MEKLPKPPETYESFVQRFPKLKEAWEQIAEAGKDGPLDQKPFGLLNWESRSGHKKKGLYILVCVKHYLSKFRGRK